MKKYAKEKSKIWNFRKKIPQKIAKKVDFRKFLDPIWDLALERVSKFVIPEFCDTLLVPKITKCGDLLYYYLRKQQKMNPDLYNDQLQLKCERPGFKLYHLSFLVIESQPILYLTKSPESEIDNRTS